MVETSPELVLQLLLELHAVLYVQLGLLLELALPPVVVELTMLTLVWLQLVWVQLCLLLLPSALELDLLEQLSRVELPKLSRQEESLRVARTGDE